MINIKSISIYSDGGARGNPGPAAYGFVIVSEGKVLAKKYKYLGNATNNTAEYKGLIGALEYMHNNKTLTSFARVDFYLDSELIVKQLTGKYRVKNPDLKLLHDWVMKLVKGLNVKSTFTHVPRQENKLADSLVNKALDEHLQNEK